MNHPQKVTFLSVFLFFAPGRGRWRPGVRCCAFCSDVVGLLWQARVHCSSLPSMPLLISAQPKCSSRFHRMCCAFCYRLWCALLRFIWLLQQLFLQSLLWLSLLVQFLLHCSSLICYVLLYSGYRSWFATYMMLCCCYWRWLLRFSTLTCTTLVACSAWILHGADPGSRNKKILHGGLLQLPAAPRAASAHCVSVLRHLALLLHHLLLR